MNDCIGCWWQEGGRCYEGNPPKDKDGRSLIKAEKLCEKFQSKRSILSSFIPNELLIIKSEERQKMKYKNTIEKMQELKKDIDKLHNEINDHVIQVAKRYIVAAHPTNRGYGHPNVNNAKFSWEIEEGGDINVDWYDSWSYGGHDEGCFSVPANFIWDEKALVDFEEDCAKKKSEEKIKEEENLRQSELEKLKTLKEKYEN